MGLLIFLSLILVAEGFGFLGGQVITFYFIVFAPVFLFLKTFKNNKNILIPKKFSFLLILFILASIISTTTSNNVQRSFEFILVYFSVFLLFIYSYNHKLEIKDKIITLIFIFAIIFCISSQLVLLFGLDTLIVQDRFQFIFQRYGHNQLGNFLLLPLSIILYWIITKGISAQRVLMLIFFLPFLIFSYSRSAYLAILILIGALITTHWAAVKKNTAIITLFAFIFSTIIFLFILIPKDINVPFLSKGREFFTTNLNLKSKFLFGHREELFINSLAFTINNPLLGIGPGNFYIASEKYAQNEMTDSAHNIFLDILVENGILSLVILLGVILIITKNIDKGVYSFAIFALFLNFQTDYSYRILSVIALFFILLGIAYNEKTTIKATGKIIISSVILFLIGVFILLSSIASSLNNNMLAITLYPFNENAHIKLLDINKGNPQIYSFMFSDYTANHYLGDWYNKQNDHKAALHYYKQAYTQKLRKDYSLVNKIYDITLLTRGKKEADKFANMFFSQLTTNNAILSSNNYEDVLIFCNKLHKTKCPYNFHDEINH